MCICKCWYVYIKMLLYLAMFVTWLTNIPNAFDFFCVSTTLCFSTLSRVKKISIVEPAERWQKCFLFWSPSIWRSDWNFLLAIFSVSNQYTNVNAFWRTLSLLLTFWLLCEKFALGWASLPGQLLHDLLKRLFWRAVQKWGYTLYYWRKNLFVINSARQTNSV